MSSSIVFLSLEKLELYTVYLESNSKKPECIILCHPTPIAKAIQFHKLGVRFIVSLCCRLDLQTTDWNDKLFYVQSAFCITFMKALKADPNFELAFTIAIHSVPATYQGVFSLSIDNQSHFTYSPKQTKYLQTLQSFSLYNPISIPMKRNSK